MLRLRQRIRVRERLPVWRLRLLLGAILLTLSELVMWQNPPSHSLVEWVLILILYVGLAAILMDIVVRFQVRGPATLILACALTGLVSSAIINHSAFDNLSAGPYGLLVRGLGLQTAAALYALLFFIVILRGKQAEPIQAAGAAAVGLLWGIWVHWYPIQERVNWGLVPIETASLYVIVALVFIGFLIVAVVPRFRSYPELRFQLLWWEAIVAGLPLFIALMVGMLQDSIPVLWLAILTAVGTFIVWALHNQREGTDPSILAEITFAAPNIVTYILLSVTFFVAGGLAYNLITDKDSIAGIAVYLIAFAFGTLGLPAASLVMFWRVYKAQNEPPSLAELLEDEPSEGN